MIHTLFISLFFTGLFQTSCGENNPKPPTGNGKESGKEIVRPASLGVVGDTTDVTVATESGIVIMGGGTDVDAAFTWMIDRAKGGDFVILRASGTDAYNPYIQKLGKVNSVETLKIDSRTLANDDGVARIIRNAELLFIAGGDQSNYMKYWKGTKVEEAIHYLANQKKIPIGGTSAGAAILGSIYYSGEKGSVTSVEALMNPYHERSTLYKDDFLKLPFMENVLADQHYVARERQGRHLSFLARVLSDWAVVGKGIGVDEKTAVCIDDKGIAKVFGSGAAYFIATSATIKPEVCLASQPLDWDQNNSAVQVYEIAGNTNGAGQFNVQNFQASDAEGGKWFNWWVERGQFKNEFKN